MTYASYALDFHECLTATAAAEQIMRENPLAKATVARNGYRWRVIVSYQDEAAGEP